MSERPGNAGEFFQDNKLCPLLAPTNKPSKLNFSFESTKDFHSSVQLLIGGVGKFGHCATTTDRNQKVKVAVVKKSIWLNILFGLVTGT